MGKIVGSIAKETNIKYVYYILRHLVELPNYSTESELDSNEEQSSLESVELPEENAVHLNEIYESRIITSAATNVWRYMNLTGFLVFAYLNMY